MYHVSDLLSNATLRSLGDKSYDRRKVAALDIERVVKQQVASQSSTWEERVFNIMNLLTAEYVCSANPNMRKGGVFGLAAVGLGLGTQKIETYLPQLIQPVLKCFDDPDSRVRYYSCEAQYNIAKTAGSALLHHFVLVFSGLCKLCADADTDVKNGAQLLNSTFQRLVARLLLFWLFWQVSVHANEPTGLLRNSIQNAFTAQIAATFAGRKSF
jgi:vacuole morphology and inheritance protein 14